MAVRIVVHHCCRRRLITGMMISSVSLAPHFSLVVGECSVDRLF